MTRLLVSVRSGREAQDALRGGCDLLDAKEPRAGSLGPVAPATLGEIVAIAGPCPVSAALGELPPRGELASVPHSLTYIKVGLAQWSGREWKTRLGEVATSRLVVAAYADHERAEAPPPEEILLAARNLGLAAFLIDTWCKDGRGLLHWIDRARLASLIAFARSSALPIALAGSLTTESVAELRELTPDWFAVRGAACEGGREGRISTQRVAALKSLLDT